MEAYNDQLIYICPDYTVEVIAQRRDFHKVTSALRAKEMKYSLRFPAKLHVHYKGQVKVFTFSQDAKSFIEQELKP